MTYLDLVIDFWHRDLEFNFSDKEIALYFYLLKTCNHTRWKNPFGLSNAITIARFGWGKSSFDTAKNNLKKAGLIDFKAGDGRGNVYQYTLIGVELSKTGKKDNEKGIQNNTLYQHLSDTLSPTLSDRKPETSIDSIDVVKDKRKKGGAKDAPTFNTVEEKKTELEKRRKEFGLSLQPYVEEFTRAMVNEFYKYWTEPNKSLTKLRFEMEKAWDTKRRLETWRRNDDKFNKGKAVKTEPAADDYLEQRKINEERTKKLLEKNGS